MSNVSYSFTHYVQYPVAGLQLQEHGTTKNTNYRLNFSLAQGTAPQFRILINGAQVNYTYNALLNLAQTVSFPGQSSAFNYSVEVYAWNYLSSIYIIDTFALVTPIVNPQVRASTVSTVFPGPILFEYYVEAGSGLSVAFSFGDTLANIPVVCTYSGEYPSNVWSQCAGTNHVFQIPGTITVVVAFSNAFNTIYQYLSVALTTSVNPIEVRTSLQLPSQPCLAAFVDNRAVASFFIQAQNSLVKPASDAQVLIIPDAINQPTVSQGPFRVTMNYFAMPSMSTSGLNVIYTAPGKIAETRPAGTLIFLLLRKLHGDPPGEQQHRSSEHQLRRSSHARPPASLLLVKFSELATEQHDAISSIGLHR